MPRKQKNGFFKWMSFDAMLLLCFLASSHLTSLSLFQPFSLPLSLSPLATLIHCYILAVNHSLWSFFVFLSALVNASLWLCIALLELIIAPPEPGTSAPAHCLCCRGKGREECQPRGRASLEAHAGRTEHQFSGHHEPSYQMEQNQLKLMLEQMRGR